MFFVVPCSVRLNMIILVFHISEDGSEIIFGHLCHMILDKKYDLGPMFYTHVTEFLKFYLVGTKVM